jgi:hypothetical protein
MDCPPQSVTRARLEGGTCDGIELLLAAGQQRIDLRPFVLRPDEDREPRRVSYAFASRVDGEGRAIFVPVVSAPGTSGAAHRARP